ncbi:hypothetical protein LTR94_031989, partial [Friedmanniomyces endolithicus]
RVAEEAAKQSRRGVIPQVEAVRPLASLALDGFDAALLAYECERETTLKAALRAHGGLWFGWSGEQTDQFTGHINFQRAHGVTTATVDLEEQDVQEYYDGYANRTLWPLFHYRIDLAEYERDFAGGYQRTNQRFADTVRPLIEADDLVWIQDYHMFPLGAELRQRGCDNRM